MTENEAKGFIQGKLDCMNKCSVFDCKGTEECDNCDYCYSQGYFWEQKRAFEMAIKALEEIQAYRAIGTVKGYERAIEVSKENYNLYREYKALLREYEAIGTVEELRALKEKAEPKKPIIHGLGQRYCPVCKCGGADHFYCTRCGQKLV